MYAPKFRSWMTRWDRFEEARDLWLEDWTAQAHADTARMVADALSAVDAILPKPVPPPIDGNAALQALYARYQANGDLFAQQCAMAAQYDAARSPFDGHIGNHLGGLLNSVPVGINLWR